MRELLLFINNNGPGVVVCYLFTLGFLLVLALIAGHTLDSLVNGPAPKEEDSEDD